MLAHIAAIVVLAANLSSLAHSCFTDSRSDAARFSSRSFTNAGARPALANSPVLRPRNNEPHDCRNVSGCMSRLRPLAAFAVTGLVVFSACGKSRQRGKSGARVPLYGGERPAGPLRFTTLTGRKVGRPEAALRIDLSALSWREHGNEFEQRRIARGTWTVVERPDGWIVGLDAGEWGGLVQWYSNTGVLLQTLTRSEPLLQFIYDDRVLLCLTGMRHLTTDTGHIHAFKSSARGWTRLATIPLPSSPVRADIHKNGTFSIEFLDRPPILYRSGLLDEDSEQPRSSKGR